MLALRSICVYCGTGAGRHPDYLAQTNQLGRYMAQAGIRLVYGGASIGLMGAIARSVLEHGGTVTGIIPKFLVEREVMLDAVDDLIVTDDMHGRKRLMFERSDAFVALPGGFGTLEELAEILTWSQLGRHRKPILIANFEGFWDPLRHLIDHMRMEGFVRPGFDIDWLWADRAVDILPCLNDALARIADRGLDMRGDPVTVDKL